ncbi:MAG: hypothetical protein ACREP9_15355 [Candidatus Dormibacteraceae bacterium]
MRRDFEGLECHRLEGLKLLRQGAEPERSGAQLKVCSQNVSRWARTLEEEGEKGLKAGGRAGCVPLLDARQRQQLVSRLLEGPEKLGYETPLWTGPRVADLIERCPCRPCLEVAAATELEPTAAERRGAGT